MDTCNTWHCSFRAQNYWANPIQQNQTARTEGQVNRPSSGYGAQPPAGAGSFQAESAANMLGGQQAEGGADGSSYLYSQQTGHNGAGSAEGY